MNVQLEPLSEIETALNNFVFIETSNPQIPIMGRIIIGIVSDKPPEELSSENWKLIMLEIGLESTDDAKNYGWWWEITLRDDLSTESVSKKHNTGYNAQYKPSCRACSIIPMEVQGNTLEDISKFIIEDISKNFKVS